MALKNFRDRAEGLWTTAKRGLALMCLWGLVFSLVTICRLGVAFDYDDTLVFSAPAFQKAFAGPAQPFSPGFWSAVNQNYDLERPKIIANSLAWLFRILGFRVAIMASRPSVDAEPLRKEWRRLVPRNRFLFLGQNEAKSKALESGKYVLFFGDGDSDVEEARKARVFPIRIRRSPKSLFKEDYHPGSKGEWVIPYSEY